MLTFNQCTEQAGQALHRAAASADYHDIQLAQEWRALAQAITDRQFQLGHSLQDDNDAMVSSSTA